jgi:hypothetical protein
MFSERDRQKCDALYTKYYAGRRFHDALYRELICRHLEPGARLLDAGCGRYLRFCREFSPIAHRPRAQFRHGQQEAALRHSR